MMRLYSCTLLAIVLGPIANFSFAADKLEQLLLQEQQIVNADKRSQQRIDQLDNLQQQALEQFRQVNKQNAALVKYNQQLEQQIANQKLNLLQLEKSILQASSLSRQLLPLLDSMLDSLERFIQLDMPFYRQERAARVQSIQTNLAQANISLAEKFRQLLEAYKIEIEYGRKISTYVDTIVIGDNKVEVNILQVGRIALVYQSFDQQLFGVWDKATASWLPLTNSSYKYSINQGIRIAKQQATISLLELPIPAPITKELDVKK